ncbi:MAG: hypothetical protein AMS27_12905 [Bacteroides sp. SM23_62_1]|nr:MAG: hypothetical protein AMS27_12905 [Bacteroides sp. SM23_62_1]
MNMTEILEILKYTLPSIIILLIVWIMLRYHFRTEDRKRRIEMTLANQKTILPIRLQAYERIALFLERISPESMIMRLALSDMTAKQLQLELLATIRAEFEHNLSQQVYISPEAWEKVRNARSNTISLINSAAEQIEPKASALTLSKMILDMMMEHKSAITTQALDYLKKEVQELF